MTFAHVSLKPLVTWTLFSF